MHGTIYFESLDELAEFLKAFCPSTAIFHVSKTSQGRWALEFEGGY